MNHDHDHDHDDGGRAPLVTTGVAAVDPGLERWRPKHSATCDVNGPATLLRHGWHSPEPHGARDAEF